MDEKKRAAFEDLLAMSDAFEVERLDLDKLNAITPGITWSNFGGACPLQGDGTYDATGEDVYFRFRHDTARLEVGVIPTGRADRDAGKVWTTRLHSGVHGVIGNAYAGDLTFDELEPVLRQLQAELTVPEPGSTYQEQMHDYVTALGEATKSNTRGETQ